MSDAKPGPAPAFSPLLSQAAKGSQRLLDFLLEQAGLTFTEWISLNIAVASEQPVETEALCGTAAERLGCPAAQVHEAVEHLRAMGLLRTESLGGHEVLGITSEGDECWHALSRQVNATSQELLGSLDPADLAAAVRVLQAFTSKAPGILAGWQRATGH